MCPLTLIAILLLYSNIPVEQMLAFARGSQYPPRLFHSLLVNASENGDFNRCRKSFLTECFKN